MKKCATVLFLLLVFHSNGQQIPQYSQWFLHQFAINPAHAGIKSCVDIHTLYRSQWQDFEGAPNTGFLTFTVPLQVKRKYAFSARHGAGFKFETGQIGQFTTNRINLAYAGHYNFNENDRLSLGIYGGVVQTGYDPTTSTTQLPDPAVMRQSNFLSPDASFGAWFNSENFYLGMALRNLFPSKWEEIGNNSRYRFHMALNGGLRASFTENVSFLPALVIRIPPGNKVSADVNLYADYKNQLGFGLGYRIGDAINAVFSIKIKEQFAVSYSYDYALTALQSVVKNTHELSFRFSTCKPRRTGTSNCPLFD